MRTWIIDKAYQIAVIRQVTDFDGQTKGIAITIAIAIVIAIAIIPNYWRQSGNQRNTQVILSDELSSKTKTKTKKQKKKDKGKQKRNQASRQPGFRPPCERKSNCLIIKRYTPKKRRNENVKGKWKSNCDGQKDFRWVQNLKG